MGLNEGYESTPMDSTNSSISGCKVPTTVVSLSILFFTNFGGVLTSLSFYGFDLGKESINY